MTLEICFTESNIYQVMGIKSLLYQYYPGDKADIHFVSSTSFCLENSAGIIFGEDVITMSLPVVSGHREMKGQPSTVMTWYIPFLSRNCPIDDIALKIKKLLNFVTTVGAPFRGPLSKLKSYTQLSEAEYRVLVLTGKGYHCHDIARMLNRSGKTVSAHYRSISRKMGAANRAEFYRFACYIAGLEDEPVNTLFL